LRFGNFGRRCQRQCSFGVAPAPKASSSRKASTPSAGSYVSRTAAPRCAICSPAAFPMAEVQSWRRRRRYPTGRRPQADIRITSDRRGIRVGGEAGLADQDDPGLQWPPRSATPIRARRARASPCCCSPRAGPEGGRLPSSFAPAGSAKASPPLETGQDRRSRPLLEPLWSQFPCPSTSSGWRRASDLLPPLDNVVGGDDGEHGRQRG